MRGFGNDIGVGQAIENALGDGDVFGECAVAAVVAAGDADHFAAVAEVDFAAAAEDAFAAIDGGVEGDAIAGLEVGDAGADGGHMPAASWPMTMGGMRRPEVPS